MYNSSIKGQGKKKRFSSYIEIPNKVFFNDMSKNYMCDTFRSCDIIYSEIAWIYGYPIFNENAGNIANEYSTYIKNINKCIEELGIPAFIICGKNVAKSFLNAKVIPTNITTSLTHMNDCQLYIWNYNDDFKGKNYIFSHTHLLVQYLATKFHKCLDFSCGYGQHLMQFEDFVGCDIDRDCLTYLSILCQEREKNYGKAKN